MEIKAKCSNHTSIIRTIILCYRTYLRMLIAIIIIKIIVTKDISKHLFYYHLNGDNYTF